MRPFGRTTALLVTGTKRYRASVVQVLEERRDRGRFRDVHRAAKEVQSELQELQALDPHSTQVEGTQVEGFMLVFCTVLVPRGASRWSWVQY